MADQKITDLTALTTVADADLLAIVDDPSGTPTTKKITKANLVKALPLANLNDYAQGSIIRGGAADWEAYDAKTDAQILVGDGTDIASVAVSGDATLANDGTVTIASLDGSNVANVANDQTTPGLPVVFAVAIAGGAAGDTDITIVGKHRIIDVWAQHTGGAGEASDTIQVKSGANAITDAMDWSGADNTVVRAASIDDANSEIADSGTLRVTTTDAKSPLLNSSR